MVGDTAHADRGNGGVVAMLRINYFKSGGLRACSGGGPGPRDGAQMPRLNGPYQVDKTDGANKSSGATARAARCCSLE
jgi:hypothetical protein